MHDGNSVITQAIHGLGGVGKSTLALDYARTHRSAYTLTWWITADSPQNLTAGLAALAERLHGQAGTDTATNVTWALTWLQTHPGWLLVLDNVEDPADLEPYLGQLDAGRVLITSRRAVGWHRLAHPVAIDVLTLDSATDLLARASGHTAPGHRPALTELATELGCLPLALEQAGAYIARNQISASDYHQLLREYPARIHATPAVLGQHERTIARTWRLTLETIATHTPLAVAMLSVLAWLAPDRLPRDVLTAPANDALAVNEALGTLAAYSMITLTENSVSVHRLVQAVARTPNAHNTEDTITHARERAAALLHIALPTTDPATDVGTWARWRALLPHVHAHTSLTTPDQDTQDTAHLLDWTGWFLSGQGQHQQAVAYAERAHQTSIRLNGPDHPGTLTSRNNLASAYRGAGDLDRAIPLYEATLSAALRVLGPDHLHTLTSRNNLASAYREAGDLDRAIPLHQATLTDRERILGSDHPDTLSSRNNLAAAYRGAGDLDRAIPLYEATLSAALRVLGPNHPHTLTSRNNLATAYQEAGDLDRAIPLYEATLSAALRVLGPNHPMTTVIRRNLHVARTAGR
ncbi:hypothetical protein AQ490_13150 [Wenjunlia vitaminophila]|uniref:Tetratricopeptide repeat protein n=1 Tax=Wenjunlia vitaminophila TaxID=76728 RepID=A0A0T6LXQ8_WENVI|nr:hypothetical protein AQ490_13150 [Wenjunlia vitaminophila]